MSEVAGGGDGGDSHLLALLVKSRDEPGVLYRVSEVMYRHSANISYVSTIGGGEIQFELEGVADHAALVDELRRLDPVRSVEIVPSFATRPDQLGFLRLVLGHQNNRPLARCLLEERLIPYPAVLLPPYQHLPES